MKKFVFKFSAVLIISSSLYAEDKISSIQIIPIDQTDTVMAIIPMKRGDVIDETTLDISKRLLLATDKFEQVGIRWSSEEKKLTVDVVPKLFFDQIIWKGDRPKRRRQLERKCVRRNESINLTQERVSQITRCLLGELQGTGYLDAHILLEPQEKKLRIKTTLNDRYTIEEIQFVGRMKLTRSRLLGKIKNELSGAFQASKLEGDSRKILRAYFDEGFYFAEVFKPKIAVNPETKMVSISWAIQEGQKMRVYFDGDVTTFKYMKEFIEREEPLPKWFVEELVDRITSDLEDQGYLSAKVSSESRFDDEVRVIKIHTDQGKRYFLDSPEWVGLAKKDVFSEYYQNFSALREGKIFKEEKYEDVIHNEFANYVFSKGYLDLEIRNIDFVRNDEKGRVKPFLYMVEGSQYLVEDYSVLGVPGELLSIQELKDLEKSITVGGIFDTINVDQLQNDLVRALIARGYLDAKLHRDIKRTEKGLSISINVFPGPRYKIEKVLIRGAHRTNYSVLKREVGLKRGDYYEKEEVNDALAQIFRLGIARSVDIRVFERDRKRGLAYVLVDLSEGPRFRFEIGPGYGTLDGLRATFRGTYSNIGGTARRISLRAKGNRELQGSSTPTGVLDPEEVPFIERHIVVEYFEPSFLGFPIDGRLTFSHRKENEELFSLIENEFSTAFDYRLNRHWIFSSHYNFAFSNPSNVAIVENTQVTDPKTKKLTAVGETITIDYLDDTFSPRKGIKTRLNFDLYDTFLGGDVNFWQTSVKQDFFYPLLVIKKKQFIGIALSVQTGFAKQYADTAEIPVEKRFYVGGENSVRGYGEKGINPELRQGGDSFFSFMSELNIPIYKGLDLLGFFDGGNVYKTIDDYRPWDMRFGAGPGIRWNTPVGPIKFGYGFILFREAGEPIGRFYLGVGPI